MPNGTERGVFETPRCLISTTSSRWRGISCATPRIAEDAVQECYLRALRHFDSYRGPAMKPWLLTILRNVCNAEFSRRGKGETPTDFADEESTAEALPLWQEPQVSPETALLREHDTDTMRRLVAELPPPFRETIVLREM